MNLVFEDKALHDICDQAAIYDCACPAQLSRQITELRDLFEYQQKCGRATPLDIQVHDRIAESVEEAHATLEKCLADVLTLQGWDRDTLQMPQALLNQRLGRE
ncbi:MAG TPA: hypothetical protein VGK09_00400 [Rhodocyclaceae bacterium]